MDSHTIRVLYENVLQDDVKANRIQESEIRKAINNMKEVYKPDPTSLQSDVVEVAHYDDAAHRCAYLHKYAPLHTALVSDMLQLAMQRNAHVFQAIINKHGSFNVCSLGGGPGNDVIAVLDVLHSVLGYFQAEATIVDIMVGWKYTFESILEELRCEDYGPISEHMSEQYFTWSYEKANLLSKMTAGSNRAIASANLITMIKFVSASSCKDTATMIGEIFRSMKAGAIVLFIDNDGGGFYKIVHEEAQFYGFKTLFLLEHLHYLKETFNVKKPRLSVPCYETKVTVCLWEKLHESAGSIYDILKLYPPTKSSQVRLVVEDTLLQNVPIPNPIPISNSAEKKRKPKQDELQNFVSISHNEFPLAESNTKKNSCRSQRHVGEVSRYQNASSSSKYASISNNGFLLIVRNTDKNYCHSPTPRRDFIRNQNGSSNQNSDEGSSYWSQFKKKLFWSFCKTAVSLPLVLVLVLSVSQNRPNKDAVMDAVAGNNDLAEYFFELFPTVWN